MKIAFKVLSWLVAMWITPVFIIAFIIGMIWYLIDSIRYRDFFYEEFIDNLNDGKNIIVHAYAEYFREINKLAEKM